MTEAAKAARRAYKREWARQNPDKVKAQQERHWEKVAAAQQMEMKDFGVGERDESISGGI